MKLFVLLSRVPWPLEKGDKLRAYHQVRHLSLHHEVFLCCLAEKPVSEETLTELRKIASHVLIIRLYWPLIALQLIRAIFSNRPFQVHYFLQFHARRKVTRAISEFKPDHIYCQLIRCADYVKQFHSIRKTIDYMDALNAGLRRRADIAPWHLRWFLREESRRVVAYENLIFDYFDAHSIISAQDRELIYHPSRRKIAVIPNGVDAEYFAPDPSVPPDTDLLFTGNMGYAPNIDCALRIVREILPLVHRIRPHTKLLIAGANPAPEILALKSDHVEVTGWVPDIRNAYKRSRVFLAPMRIGSGLQNKILEALSMGLPCITTPLASNALNEQVNRTLISTPHNDVMAREVIRLLEDDQARNSSGAAGKQAVQDSYDWAATSRQLELLFFEPTNPYP